MFEYISERFFVNLHQKREIERGLILEKSGDRESALKIFEDLVSEYPNCKPCRFYMGKVSMAIKQQVEDNIDYGPKKYLHECSK